MLSPLKFVVSAPGKVILFGEHSVVYGKPALAAAINKRTSLIFETNDSDFIKLNFSNLNLVLSIPLALIQNVLSHYSAPNSTGDHSSEDLDLILHEHLLSISTETYERVDGCKRFDARQRLSILPVFYTLFRLYKSVTISAFTVTVFTDLAIGAGTGSSASYCVCLAAALFHYFRIPRENVGEKNYLFSSEDKKVINACAFACEQIIHGKASGLDNFVCTYGSVIEAVSDNEMKKVFRAIENVFRLKILLVNTGMERSTAKMVKIVSNVRSRNSKIIDRILDIMAELCDTASSTLVNLKNNEAEITGHVFRMLFEKLEDLVTLNHGLLAGLQVSNTLLDDIANTTRTYGLHTKVTGAGGGGYALTFIPPYISKEVVQNCRNALESNGYTVEEIVIGEEGVDIKTL